MRPPRGQFACAGRPAPCVTVLDEALARRWVAFTVHSIHNRYCTLHTQTGDSAAPRALLSLLIGAECSLDTHCHCRRRQPRRQPSPALARRHAVAQPAHRKRPFAPSPRRPLQLAPLSSPIAVLRCDMLMSTSPTRLRAPHGIILAPDASQRPPPSSSDLALPQPRSLHLPRFAPHSTPTGSTLYCFLAHPRLHASMLAIHGLHC